MKQYFLDLKDNMIIPEDFINPFSPSSRYIHLDELQIRNLINWVQEDELNETSSVIPTPEREKRIDLITLNAQGLDKGIRCAMCTNSMANDRGCDGGCVVDTAMYERVLKVIEENTVPEREKGEWIPAPFDFELFQAGLMDMPKGMTNRDVIQALFPNATFKDAFIDTFTEITFVGSGYALLKKEWLESGYNGLRKNRT